MFGKFSKLAVIAILVAIVAVGLRGATSSADPERSGPADRMTLSPVKDRQKLEPGKQFDGQFTITNTGSQPFDFRVYVKPFSIGEDCVDQYDINNDYTLMTKWVNFEQNNYYNVEPDKVQVVKFSIDVPKNAPSGGQYIVIFAETGKFDPNGGAAVGVNTRVGYKFYGDLGGKNIESGRVESIRQGNWFWEPPINGSSTVRNTGNVDFTETHTYTIKTLGGKEVYNDSQSEDVLPDTCRKITHTWGSTPTLGIFWVENTIEFLGREQSSEKKLVIVVPIYIVVIFSLVITLLLWALVLKIKGGKKTNPRKT